MRGGGPAATLPVSIRTHISGRFDNTTLVVARADCQSPRHSHEIRVARMDPRRMLRDHKDTDTRRRDATRGATLPGLPPSE